MKSETDRKSVFTRRALVLAGAQGLAVTALMGRMYYLGVVQGSQYETLAEENRVSLRLLAPPRGEIVDRYGRVMATNRQDYRVFLIPEQARDVAATLEKLGRIITLTPGQIRLIERKIARQRAFMRVTVADNLDWQAFARINVLSPELPGIQPDSGTTRWYPDADMVSQIVGYVGAPAERDMDGDPLLTLPGFKVGKRGIEKVYEKTLRGTAGTTRVEVNAYGREIRELSRTEGQSGDRITLTIDRDLQRFAARRLGEESGGVVVMDVDSGDVLVHASMPSYDPNEFNLGISRENWRALIQDPRKPLVNKCTAGQYPPGSTFKMVVALAALHYGVVTPEDEEVCHGHYRYGDNTFHCWRKYGHGKVDMVTALARSCDVYFYKVAKEVGIERIAEFARAFGLGEDYGFELPARHGLVPTPGWKLANTGRPWVGGDTLNVGIGQGALLATPLQTAVMTARIANGGRQVVPRLVRAIAGQPTEPAPVGVIDLDPAHLAVIRRGMEAVMEYRGTAYTSRLDLDGFAMAGKTGTAQVRRITQADRDAGVKNEDKPWAERHHAWFVAYAPIDTPRYAIGVLVEHGGGGASAAAPVARDVMAEVLKRRRPQASGETRKV
ncbi:penicillin-binding protein 2 [Rhodothalassium salexigens]|uniref:penicillin-binding protein 2 n=1 Tax=Rhodothalassium salexigens TaxID=1086 RepID=UPI001912917D|nr:penicillin-binding protein 2 [Rhodothalassium salexigens]MBK5921784.1 penicillin-binding protein 2 [Rhodothalassium salexigens]